MSDKTHTMPVEIPHCASRFFILTLFSMTERRIYVRISTASTGGRQYAVPSSGLSNKFLYVMSANLMPATATPTAPSAPKTGFPTVNPTIAPKTPRQIATINKIFCVELPAPDRLFSWHPHDGQLSAVSEIDFLHSEHSTNAISIFLSCRICS